MSLTKLFNKNYFVQNILKSKAVIAVLIGIIPILNAIYLLAVSSGLNDVMVANLNLVSVLNIIGMYVLPVILSLCLFGYVFKKKSVDFINSMPLTRKQIFITNSIGGVLLIIVIMLINTLLLCIESLLFSNIIISFAMIIDYFIIWTVSYIFVFTAANVAVSVSGNHVTMIVVTAIILFFVPFMHNYLTGFNGMLYQTPYYIETTEQAATDSIIKDPYVNVSIERIEQDIDYTLPYNYISTVFKGEVKTYSTVSIIKMVVLSVVYFGIGMYLFEKRKMEVNETSFKSDNAHMLVKSLTLIPIGAFALILMNESGSFTANLFIFVLIIAYCFIYDLITTKTIRNFKLGVVYFVATAMLSIGLYYGAEYINEKVEGTKEFDVDKITSVACYINEVEYSLSYFNGKMFNTYLENETLVNMVKDILKQDQEYKAHSNYLRIRLKLENNEKYEARVYVNDAEYDKIKELVLNDDKYEAEYKNIDYSKVKLVAIDDVMTLTGKDMEEFLSKIQSAIESVDLAYPSNLPNIENVKLELYQNHDNVKYYIPLNISEDLLTEYVNMSNKRAASYEKIGFWVNDARIFNDNNYPDNFHELFIDDEIREYVKDYINNNQNEQVDVTKPILAIYAYTEEEKDDYTYVQMTYFTNNVSELIQEVSNIINARGDLDE